MLKHLVFVLVFVGTFSVMGLDRLGTLEGVLEPQILKVHGNELFVVEDHVIFIFHLPDLKPVRSISRQGEGPGEFTLDPSRSLNISVHDNSILAQSRSKYIFFDRKGVMQREGRKLPAILQLYPLGERYVVLRMTTDDNGRQYFGLNIYDEKMNNIKELHRQKFFTFGQELHPMPDPLNFCVMDNLIFVEKSTEGFVIDVFDGDGNKVKSLTRDYRRIELTDEAEEAALQDLLRIPSVQRVRDSGGQGAVNTMLREYKIVYPKHLPAIENIIADGSRLYVKTYERTTDGDHWVVLDQNGKLVKDLTLPYAARPPYLVRLQGDKNYYTVCDGYYYFLRNLEDEDLWEVYREKL